MTNDSPLTLTDRLHYLSDTFQHTNDEIEDVLVDIAVEDVDGQGEHYFCALIRLLMPMDSSVPWARLSIGSSSGWEPLKP